MPKEERKWGMLCHLAGLVSIAGIGPFLLGNIIAPLAVWLMKKEDSEFIDQQGKAALNFQITVAILAFISLVLCFLVVGFVLLPLVMILQVYYTIQAAIKANEGESYTYPVSFKFF